LRVVPHFLWDNGWADLDVLVVAHGGAKVVIFYVKPEVAGAFAGIGDGAIDVDLGVEHGDGGGARIAGVIKFVAAGCHADSMGFFLLRTDGADEVCVGHFATVWDLGLVDEENGAGAGDAFGRWSRGANTVGEQSAPFIGKASSPVPRSLRWGRTGALSGTLACQRLGAWWLVRRCGGSIGCLWHSGRKSRLSDGNGRGGVWDGVGVDRLLAEGWWAAFC
jgi:hypothetical protein